MPNYTGKMFEEDFRESAWKNADISVDRLYDNIGGFAGVFNICDFIVYCYPCVYYVELKAHKGKSLPFTCITDNQWDGLIAKAQKPKGVMAGVIIHYSDLSLTFFVNILALQHLRASGEKSLPIAHAAIIGVPLHGRLKRVRWEYTVDEAFFNSINKKGVVLIGND